MGMSAMAGSVAAAVMGMSLLIAPGASAEPKGEFTTFAEVPGSSAPHRLALGADGAMWFTQQTTGEIGRVVAGRYGD